MKKSEIKTKGIVRHIDSLGRIVVPREYRKSLGIKVEDSLEMILTKEGILIKVANDTSKLESYTNEELIKELKLRGLMK